MQKNKSKKNKVSCKKSGKKYFKKISENISLQNKLQRIPKNKLQISKFVKSGSGSSSGSL